MKLTIPYYLHKAGAGFPSPATDYIEEDIDLNMHLIKNVPATFIIRVQGKSMVDVGINDGDLSRRLMRTLKRFNTEIEGYSIDEAFIDLSNFPDSEVEKVGREIRETVLQWTGIPTSILSLIHI